MPPRFRGNLTDVAVSCAEIDAGPVRTRVDDAAFRSVVEDVTADGAAALLIAEKQGDRVAGSAPDKAAHVGTRLLEPRVATA